MTRPARNDRQDSRRLRYRKELERLFEEYKAKLVASDPAYGGSKKKALMDRFEASKGEYDEKDFDREAELWKQRYRWDPNKRPTLARMTSHNPELNDPSKSVLRPGETPSIAMARYSKKVVDDEEKSVEKATKYGIPKWWGYGLEIAKFLDGIRNDPWGVAGAIYGMLKYTPMDSGVYSRAMYGANKRMAKRARASSMGATMAEREAYANGLYEFKPGYFNGPKVKSPDDVWEELKRIAAKRAGYKLTKADLQEKPKY